VRRILVIAAVVLACVGLALALGAKNGDSSKGHYKIVFDNAFGLTPGGDFKIAGVRAGKTTSFHIEGQARPRAVVEAEVTRPGFPALRADAQCEIRPQSFIGEYFVDCQPGSSKRVLPDGARIPVEQTTSTIPFDLVASILRRPYRDRLRLIVNELGAGLAGRSDDLNDAIRRADPGLRDTSKTLRILGRQTRTIKRFIGDADRVIAQLEARRHDVTRFVRDAGETAATTASRRTQLAETFRRLPDFLGELEPYMNRLGDLAQAQRPVLDNLQASAGQLDTFLTRLRPFAQAGTPALESLGQAAVVGRRAVLDSQQEVQQLEAIGKAAPGLAKPLRQFLQTTDDRSRAVEPDSRAAATGPPAPDKTHITSSGAGFTGMEAIWDYFYWQALTTNALDNTGHVLRIGLLTVPSCLAYTTKPEAAGIKECNQFLGPTQPGVTTPDPTRTSSKTSSATVSPASASPATGAPARTTNRLLDYLLAP
jgi:virulence factor Mce-like protein